MSDIPLPVIAPYLRHGPGGPAELVVDGVPVEQDAEDLREIVDLTAWAVRSPTALGATVAFPDGRRGRLDAMASLNLLIAAAQALRRALKAARAS